MVKGTSRWAAATAAGTVVVTAVDAVLLDRSKGYFRGGFLTVDRLEGPLQTAAFLAVSLLVDAAFIGLVIALVSRTLRLTSLRPQARMLAGLIAGAGMLLAYDAAYVRLGECAPLCN